MLSLTKKTDYALIALGYLAERRDKTVSAREIAQAYAMPSALVMNILKTLHHATLISSTRGTKGGYRLVADLDKVSLYDLIETLEGPVRLAECVLLEGVHCEAQERIQQGTPPDDASCKIRQSCPIQTPIRTLHARLVKFLRDVKLADILSNSDGKHAELPGELVGLRE